MIYLILFIFEVTILTISERKRWGHLITPLNVLMLTYAFATIVAIIYSYSNKGIPNFYLPSLIVWMMGLLLFAIPSVIFSSQLRKKHSFSVIATASDDNFVLLRNIAFFCIIVSFVKLRNLSGSIDSFGTNEFSDDYQTSSVFSHLSNFLLCIFAYSVYKIDKNHLACLFIIGGSLVGLYAIGTKSWIIAPFLMGYFARILTGKTIFSIKTTLLPIALIFVIFFISYYLAMVYALDVEFSVDFLLFIVNHFLNYFCGANLAFSLDFQNGIVEPEMTEALFAPILNIFNAIFGAKYVNPINPIFFDMGDFGTNNVRTALGTFLCYSHSYWVLALMTFLYGLISNYLYFASLRSHSLFMLLANCCMLTFLTLGFFDFYWMNLAPYEVLIFFLLMSKFLYRRKRNEK